MVNLPNPVGIETLGGIFTPLLQKGTATPCSLSEIFSTAADNQKILTLTLCRGNNKLVADCIKIGKYQVVDIPPLPRGKPQIKITFAVKDSNIILSALDLNTNKTIQIKKIKKPF